MHIYKGEGKTDRGERERERECGRRERYCEERKMKRKNYNKKPNTARPLYYTFV